MTQNESYTLKEMLTEMRMDMREHVEKHERDMTEIKFMFTNTHKEYQTLKDEHSQFKTVVKTVSTIGAGAWAVITFIVPNLLK